MYKRPSLLSVTVLSLVFFGGVALFETADASSEPIEFSTPVEYNVGLAPYSIFCADLNADGNTDIAIANSGYPTTQGSFSVLLNNGDGTFFKSAEYLAGKVSSSVCCANLDGNEGLDVAIANQHSGDVSVFNNNGDGTFAPKVDYAAGGGAYALASGDFDEDDDIDLAVCNFWGGSVSILSNDGPAGFATSATYSVGDRPVNVVSADLDADGHVDLAVAVYNSDKLCILYNDTHGNFTQKADYPCGDGTRFITVADLDGDLDVDMAVATEQMGAIHIFRNEGQRDFSHYSFNLGEKLSSVSAADLDGDLDLDLVASDWGTNRIYILKNHGDGTFDAADSYQVGSDPFHVVCSDLDSDEAVDLAVARGWAANSVVVLLNSGPSFGSVFGTVSELGAGVSGIPIDLYDADGMIVASTISGEFGEYNFPNIDNGFYTVGISTPLGYVADSDMKTVEVAGSNHEVNFELTRLEIPVVFQALGYWVHQVNALLKDKDAQESWEDMCEYMELIRTHFNLHGLNPVNVFEVDLNSDCQQRLEALRATISPTVPSTMNAKARAHLTAVLLNMVSTTMGQWTVISEDGATISQAITYLNILVGDNNSDNDEMAKDISEMINEGIIVPAGLIDLSTPTYVYKTGGVPNDFALSQNHPNPFNPATEISFSLPHSCHVNLEIFNIMGQRISTLVDRQMAAGHHIVNFDGSDVASGVYMYRLQAGDFVESKKMMLVK